MTPVAVRERPASHPAAVATGWLFGFVTFASAFLLFLIQPLIARALLPWFGGSAAVWAACLMFFQTALVAGYAYAHLSARLLSGWKQSALHVGILALTLFAFPVLPGVKWKPSGASWPEWDILIILAVTVGAPYFVLASTSPMLQAWFARTRPGISPYALYALSNGGSLLGLLAYPLLIEPAMRLRTQAAAWSIAYAGLRWRAAGWRSWFADPPRPWNTPAPFRCTDRGGVESCSGHRSHSVPRSCCWRSRCT